MTDEYDGPPFAELITALHARNTYPTLASLESRTGLSINTIRRALSGSNLPKWSTAEKLIKAMGGETEEFRAAYRDAKPGLPSTVTEGQLFHNELMALWGKAGGPSHRVVADKAGLSYNTVAWSLRGSILPKWETCEVLIRALGGDPAEFADAHAQAKLTQKPPPTSKHVMAAHRVADREVLACAARIARNHDRPELADAIAEFEASLRTLATP